MLWEGGCEDGAKVKERAMAGLLPPNECTHHLTSVECYSGGNNGQAHRDETSF